MDSNHRHPPSQGGALPTELRALEECSFIYLSIKFQIFNQTNLCIFYKKIEMSHSEYFFEFPA